MDKEEILEFIKSRARATKRKDSNCMGTTFYLVGEKNEDLSVGRKESLEILSKLKDSNFPEEGHIVYWGDRDYPIHSGVVFDKDVLTMVHRKKKNSLLEIGSIEKLSESFGFPYYKIPNMFDEGGKK